MREILRSLSGLCENLTFTCIVSCRTDMSVYSILNNLKFVLIHT